MDLSKFSDDDLLALQSNDLTKISDSGLQLLQQSATPKQQPLTTNLESVGGFEMPDYNRPSKTYLEDEKQFRDALILEIKALKNGISSQLQILKKRRNRFKSCMLTLRG
jgi:hypothetical protein